MTTLYEPKGETLDEQARDLVQEARARGCGTYGKILDVEILTWPSDSASTVIRSFYALQPPTDKTV